MCIFTGEVERVAGTRIFARLADGVQHLAYDMLLGSASATAMLLPLPVAPGSGGSALRFVSLERYPDLFDDLETCFPPDGAFMGRFLAASAEAPTLEVQRVGAFDASYAPTLADLDRLDPRFRLPEAVWSALPQYGDHGFAVFTLRPGESRVHPMAFSFRTRDPGSLFFPTVHVHDRRVGDWAHFDHALYAQGRLAPNRDWVTSEGPLGGRLRGDAAGLVATDEYAHRRLLYGVGENRDTRVALAG